MKPTTSQVNGINRLFSVAEIAEMLSVPPKTVYYWVSRRQIPFIKAGKHVRFMPQDVITHFVAHSMRLSDACLTTNRLSKVEPCSLKTREETLPTTRR